MYSPYFHLLPPFLLLLLPYSPITHTAQLLPPLVLFFLHLSMLPWLYSFDWFLQCFLQCCLAHKVMSVFDWEGIRSLFIAFASLSAVGNGCAHKCQRGGGISKSIIRMNAPTHTHFHSQMYTKTRPHIQNFWCPEASMKPHTGEKRLHRNIMRIPINLYSCFTKFLHNGDQFCLMHLSVCVYVCVYVRNCKNRRYM